jgi:hypothetical protein
LGRYGGAFDSAKSLDSIAVSRVIADGHVNIATHCKASVTQPIQLFHIDAWHP